MENISEVNASAVRQMVESAGWKEITVEINLWIDDLKELLAESGENAEQHRGSIKALRNVLNWPETVANEDHLGSMVKNLPKGELDADRL